MTMTTWNLSRILDRPAEAITDADRRVKEFERWRGKLTPTMDTADFGKIIGEYRELTEAFHRLGAYGHMMVDSDSSDAAARALQGKIDDFLGKAENRIRFFTHWWKTLDDAQASQFHDELGDDKYIFELMRRLRQHTLPEEQENIISLKDTTGVMALNNIYDTLISRKIFTITVDGEEKNLTGDELRAFFSDHRADVRKAAYDEFLRIIAVDRDIIGDIYRNIIVDWEHERELRGYASAISMRNKSNDLPDEVIASHLAACRESAPLWHRYFALKENLLGDRITRYDIYAPWPEVHRTYSYDDALRLTLDTLKSFSPRFDELAREIYDSNQVDVYPRPHKTGGAYCWMVTPQLPPFLLYNFSGKITDVTTVAHETGHGVHSQLCRHLTPLSSSHPIPIAETASIFSEMLLTERLQRDEKDAAVKRFLLMRKLDDLFASIGRQSFFVIFEQQAHEMLARGATVDELSSAYLTLLHEQFGGMEIPAAFKDEWLAIPHIFRTPFYCYGYSFGNLLTLGLYEQYRREGAAFIPKYERFLSSGSTMPPVELCAQIGIDVTKKEFWLEGFKTVERMMDELEKL
jgi:oligoendopeptidase F